jgi:hypothetical protein
MMTVGKMAKGNIEQLGKATEIFFSPFAYNDSSKELKLDVYQESRTSF